MLETTKPDVYCSINCSSFARKGIFISRPSIINTERREDGESQSLFFTPKHHARHAHHAHAFTQIPQITPLQANSARGTRLCRHSNGLHSPPKHSKRPCIPCQPKNSRPISGRRTPFLSTAPSPEPFCSDTFGIFFLPLLVHFAQDFPRDLVHPDGGALIWPHLRGVFFFFDERGWVEMSQL